MRRDTGVDRRVVVWALPPSYPALEVAGSSSRASADRLWYAGGRLGVSQSAFDASRMAAREQPLWRRRIVPR